MMASGYLLDTHILLRGLLDKKRLTREQYRVLEEAVQRQETLAISSASLVEIAILASDGRLRLSTSLAEFFDDLQANPVFELLPVTYEIALEVACLAALRDPADRTIVATGRVHGLRLLTSDQRIIESRLVPVVD
jgi:PIN domain nuclease of toxin-antitoxin system